MIVWSSVLHSSSEQNVEKCVLQSVISCPLCAAHYLPILYNEELAFSNVITINLRCPQRCPPVQWWAATVPTHQVALKIKANVNHQTGLLLAYYKKNVLFRCQKLEPWTWKKEITSVINMTQTLVDCTYRTAYQYYCLFNLYIHRYCHLKFSMCKIGKMWKHLRNGANLETSSFF